MNVSQLMNANVISVGPDTAVTDAAALLSRYDIGALPVVDGTGKLRGIVTDRDIVLRYVAQGAEGRDETPVRDIMTRNVVTIPSTADVREAAAVMSGRQIRRLPVVEDARLVGMISIGDLSSSREYSMEAGKALADITEKKKK